MNRFTELLALVIIATISTFPAMGQNSTGFTYQGDLKENGQAANGPFNFEFSLWDAVAGGNQIGSTIITNGLQVTNGLFTVDLDFGANALDNSDRWLQIAIDSTTLVPRQPITRAPYSIQTRGIFVDEIQNVGIGTVTPEHPFHLVGDMRAEGRMALGNDAFFGVGGGGRYPEYDRVYDFSHVITDFSSSDYWSPVLSVFTLDPNQDLSSHQVYANSFEVHTSANTGRNMAFVNGLAGGAVHRGTGTVSNLFGAFLFSGPQGPGVVTRNFGTFVGATAGFDGGGSIVDNRGIDISTGHHGNTGSIQTNQGLYVHTPFTARPIDMNYGIFLEDQNVAQTTNYAIYSAGGDMYLNGGLEITGTLSKGGGSFRIDHPLDPENKYLSHSFVESPDMMNIYNGNVVTDDDGLAVVELPDYFESLNRDFRYQLTVIGTFAQAIIAEEITENRFVIRTDQPRVKVSWQVTGIRHDPYAEQHRIQVEERKPFDQRGLFLHPEAFGLSSDRAIGRRQSKFAQEQDIDQKASGGS